MDLDITFSKGSGNLYYSRSRNWRRSEIIIIKYIVIFISAVVNDDDLLMCQYFKYYKKHKSDTHIYY